MSKIPNFELTTNNNINSIKKDIRTINSDINAIEQDIIDLQANSGGGGSLVSLKDKYYYQTDFVINYQQNLSSGMKDWYENGTGIGYDGLIDYDTTNGIRGCRRVHVNLTSNSDYATYSQTPIKPNSFTTFTLETKFMLNTASMGANQCKVFIGFADSDIAPNITKSCLFKSTCTVANRTFGVDCAGSTTSLTALTNLQFYKVKIVVNKLTDIKFYVNDVLVRTVNAVDTSFLYYPIVSISGDIFVSNTPSVFVWQDLWELLIEYDAGNR